MPTFKPHSVAIEHIWKLIFNTNLLGVSALPRFSARALDHAQMVSLPKEAGAWISLTKLPVARPRPPTV